MRAGEELVVVVRGRLDGRLGLLLVRALEAADERQTGVVVDLFAVDSFTSAGVTALARCMAERDRLPSGLRVRADAGPGRRALMAAVGLRL